MTETITFWNEETLPRLGMGCWAIGGPFWAGEQAVGWGQVDDKESIAAIHAALEMGIRFFDTADVYGAGHSERVVAKAFKGRAEKPTISTKFGNKFDETSKKVTGANISPEEVRSAIEASLKRLEIDQLDMIYFHQNDYVPIETVSVFDTLEALCDEGKLSAYGWSTDFVDSAKSFADRPNFKSVQLDMNLFLDTDPMLDLLSKKSLVGVARQPLAMGLLSGKFASGKLALPTDDIRANSPDWLAYFKNGEVVPEYQKRLDAVKELLRSDGRTLAQGALAWIWARSPDMVPIPGFRTVAQVEENVRALEFGALPDDVMDEIGALL